MGLITISIVTATYNQGNFIKETFDSIKAQNYNALEYFVFDGGSKDNTLSIIKENEHLIKYWESKQDEGAADAINKGFKISNGELINWLNSDDMLLPNTLHSLNVIANKFPDYDIYAFLGLGMGVNGGYNSVASMWNITKLNFFFRHFSFAQESTFIKREFLTENKINIDKTLSNIFDTKLYSQCLDENARVLFIDTYAGIIRHHVDAKTSFGVAPLEMQKLKELNSDNGFIFKFLKRLYISKIGWIMLLLNNKIGIAFISLITRKPIPHFNTCRFKYFNIFDSESWFLKK